MELVVLDTNILIDLLNENEDVLNEFLKNISKRTFIPLTVCKEFFDETKDYDKGINEAKSIYECNVLLKGKEEIFKESYLKKIFDNLKEIKKIYNIQCKELEEIFIRKKELLNEKSKKQKFRNKILESEFENFICDINQIISKLESDYKIENSSKLLQNTKILLEEFTCYHGKLLENIKFHRDEERLYKNYSNINTFIKSNLNDKYSLIDKEMERIISIYNNTDRNWWGKKDQNKKKEKDRYNDQFIWNEIIKFSFDVNSDLIFLTNDHKDFDDSELKKEMEEEISKKTNYKVLISKLNEYEPLKEIQKKQYRNYILEFLIEGKFREDKYVDDVLNDTINFIEKNSEEFSECLRFNKDRLEEAFFEEEYDEEYLVAIDLINSYEGSYKDFYEDVDIRCKLIELSNDKIAFNIIVNFYVLEQSEFKVTYEVICNGRLYEDVKDVKFQISGEEYEIESAISEDECLRQIEKIMIEELWFKNCINPIFKVNS